MQLRSDHYRPLHEKYGVNHPKANGYRSVALFAREQAVVLERIDASRLPILDIGCGTGLTLQPLLKIGVQIFGLDFDASACRAARARGMSVTQGNAFDMPFATASIVQVVNCGFINQFEPAKLGAFFAELGRILVPGGRGIILHRHAKSLMHQIAHPPLRVLDRIFGGQPDFPQYTHSPSDVRRQINNNRLDLVEEGVTLPPPGPRILPTDHPASWLIGASQLIVFKKPDN